MFKLTLTGLMAAVSIAGFASGGFAKEQTAEHNRMCESVFAKNQADIEKMVGAGNIAGVQSIFVRANCPEFGGRALTNIKCTVTILPPAIICTFGAR